MDIPGGQFMQAGLFLNPAQPCIVGRREFPAQTLLLSIQWREAWKYVERAFRYGQHDAGHAIGALRIAAATLSWKASLLGGLADDTIDDLLGLNRAEDFSGSEREHPVAVLAVWPPNGAGGCTGLRAA